MTRKPISSCSIPDWHDSPMWTVYQERVEPSDSVRCQLASHPGFILLDGWPTDASDRAADRQVNMLLQNSGDKTESSSGRRPSIYAVNPWFKVSVQSDGHVLDTHPHANWPVSSSLEAVLSHYLTVYGLTDSRLFSKIPGGFKGGFLGCFFYEFSKCLGFDVPGETLLLGENLENVSDDTPLAWFGFYTQFVVVSDTQWRYVQLVLRAGGVAHTPVATSIIPFSDLLDRLCSSKPDVSGEVLSDVGERGSVLPSFACEVPRAEISYDLYHRAFRAVEQHIYDGDTYQINLTHRYRTDWSGDPFDFYLELRSLSPAGYSAYLNLPFGHIWCNSPELLCGISADRRIMTRPIKGTIARGQSQVEDLAYQNQLIHSEKDRAELTMIVDLVRHDLGQVCRYGSVSVTHHHRLETYPFYHHLVSEIVGELRADVSPVRACLALFPGGSVTGAPKRRSMSIISQVESVPRRIYTGSIGYFGLDQSARFNIAIRTAYSVANAADDRANDRANDRVDNRANDAGVHMGDKGHNSLFFHVGGGIVADSVCDTEWIETRIKAQGILSALSRFEN